MVRQNIERLHYVESVTPLQEMQNLQKALGVRQRLFVKRDDLTENGLGGNKNRKLDYVMKEARDKRADTIVTWGAAQSNHMRQTLAFAKRLGMDCHLLVNGRTDEPVQGNLLLYKIMGAHLHFEPDSAKCPDACEAIAQSLWAEGRNPYVVSLGASVALGSVGYVDSYDEIVAQCRAIGVTPGAIFLATGSAGTQAGLEAGARLSDVRCDIHGVAVSRDRAAQAQMVAAQTNALLDFLGCALRVQDAEIIIHDTYYGESYGCRTQSAIDAILTLARTEAIILDPVYTGKAMAGMLDLLRKGRLDQYDAVVFVHTGGSPALFRYAEWFEGSF